MPWDLSRKSKGEKARAMRREQQPYMLIGSPCCRAFSTLQYLNEARSKDASAYRIAKAKAAKHINFMIGLYREHIEDGHYFLHEHPRWATSWKLPEMEKLMAMPGLGLSHADQCQYGAEAQRGTQRGSPILRPTGFMSNSPKVTQSLAERCEGQGGLCSPMGPWPRTHRGIHGDFAVR